MKSSKRPPSTTSLPRAPRDDVDARSTRYLVLMGIRIVCFVLMVVITPYGWYTVVLGAAAIFLPYIAVVSANVGEEARGNRREDPEPALPAAPTPPADAVPRVIRLEESSPPAARDASPGAPPAASSPPAPPSSPQSAPHDPVDQPPRPDEAA